LLRVHPAFLMRDLLPCEAAQVHGNFVLKDGENLVNFPGE